MNWHLGVYVAAVGNKPTPKVVRGAGPTPVRFGGASAAAPAAAVATAQPAAKPKVGSLVFAHLQCVRSYTIVHALVVHKPLCMSWGSYQPRHHSTVVCIVIMPSICFWLAVLCI